MIGLDDTIPCLRARAIMKSLFLIDHRRGSTPPPRGGAGGAAQATVPQHTLANMPCVVKAHVC